MKLTCPSCCKLIPADQMNLGTDVALCPCCNEAFSISALVAAGQDSDEVDLFDPPRGAWFSETYSGWTIGATTRSPMALFLVPFMCVWSGGSLGGIYGSQIVQGEFNLAMSLFGIPFVLGTLAFGSMAVMTVCGKTTVTVDNFSNASRIFTGVGPIGWTRRFEWASITRIEEDYPGYQSSGSSGMVIVLIGRTRLKFGSMLTDPRRYFLLQGLRKQLSRRPK